MASFGSALEGQTVLIFGGSQGMGKAAAKAVLACGGTPFIVSRSEGKLVAAASEISPSDPSRVKYASCDCKDEAALQAFFEAQAQGSFNHMVCTIGESAGCSDIRGAEGFRKLKEQFEIKVFAQLAPICFGVDKMADGGSIVITSGALSRRPGGGSSALGAANASLESIIKGLANDFGPRVRVNCISPGLTNTDMWSSMDAEKREGMLAGFGSRLPLKRAGEPNDVGEAIAMLLCARYTTGCTLDCDGGAAIRA